MKRIFSVIMILCLLLVGCGQSKTAKPIYELSELDWGASIEQAEQVYGEMTPDELYSFEKEQYAKQAFRVDGAYQGYPVEYLLTFLTVGERSYLTGAVIWVDIERVSDKEHLDLINLFAQDFYDISISHELGEQHSTYSVPTTAELTEKQQKRYADNCNALGLKVQENDPLIDITLYTSAVWIEADCWTLANVDIAME